MSELLGKETIDINTYNRSYGARGSFARNDQQLGRELLTADEVRLLDNQFALLFIRGERPVKDLKYDILKHPNVVLTADGKAEPYVHGEADEAAFTVEFVQVAEAGDGVGFAEGGAEDGVAFADEPCGYVLMSEEDVEKLLADEEADKGGVAQ